MRFALALLLLCACGQQVPRDTSIIVDWSASSPDGVEERWVELIPVLADILDAEFSRRGLVPRHATLYALEGTTVAVVDRIPGGLGGVYCGYNRYKPVGVSVEWVPSRDVPARSALSHEWVHRVEHKVHGVDYWEWRACERDNRHFCMGEVAYRTIETANATAIWREEPR